MLECTVSNKREDGGRHYAPSQTPSSLPQTTVAEDSKRSNNATKFKRYKTFGKRKAVSEV